MEFSYFYKLIRNNTIILKNYDPIEDINNIKFYKEDSTGDFFKKEFRWSFDSIHWSSWQNLNQTNITNISINGNKYLYLEIGYLQYIPSRGSVNSFKINYVT